MACKVSSGGGSSIEVFIDGAEVEVEDNIYLNYKTTASASVSTLPSMYSHGESREYVRGGVIYNDKIHIFGGGYSPYYTSVNHWEFTGSNWVSAPTAPFSIDSNSYCSPIVYNDELYLIYRRFDINGLYKLNGSTWAKISSLPVSFMGCAIIYDGSINILSETNHYKWNGSNWVRVSTIPVNVNYDNHNQIVVYNNEIHILNRTNHYKWNGQSWSTSSNSLPYVFINGCAIVYNGEIHILGSYYNDDVKRKHYKWNGLNWTSRSLLPYPFYNGISLEKNNAINILGGDGYDDSGYVSTKHYSLTDSYSVLIN